MQALLDDGFEVILTGFEVPGVDVVLDTAAEAKSDHGDDLIRIWIGHPDESWVLASRAEEYQLFFVQRASSSSSKNVVFDLWYKRV